MFNSFFLDTTTLCPDLSEMYTDREFNEADTERQMEWFEAQLANSTAPWKIVFCHYPIYSGGENGAAKEMKPIETLFYKYKVDAYFCGHDHSFQHIFTRNTGIHYFVCGAGSSTCRVRNIPKYTVASHLVPGFLYATIHTKPNSSNNIKQTPSSPVTSINGSSSTSILTVKFINQNGSELYSVDIPKKL